MRPNPFIKGATTMSNTTKNPSLLAVLGHLFLGVITGGFWFIVLFVWYVLKK